MEYFFDVDFDQILCGIFTFLLGRSSLKRYQKKGRFLSLLTALLFLMGSAGYFAAAFRMGKGNGGAEEDEDEFDDFDDGEAEEA